MLKNILAAITFLTICPCPSSWAGDKDSLPKSVRYFPVVGILIALFIAGCAALWIKLFPPAVAAALTVFCVIGISGGFHLDGLADTFDGFFSSRNRDKILMIMHDSRIGTMGTAAIFFVLSLKIVSLSCLQDSFYISAAVSVFLGRSVMSAHLRTIRYARNDGLGKIFFERNRLDLVIIVMIMIIVLLLIYGLSGFIIAIILLFAMLCFNRFCLSKINGATGDTAGAICELTECLFLVGMSALNGA